MSFPKHIAVVVISLFVFLGIPAFFCVDIPSVLSGDTDAVTHATMELPAQPSGEFVVLLNSDRFSDSTMEQWSVFFSGEDAGVIMSDIRCMVVDTDDAGQQLAARYQARLPENQMQIKQENGLLLASKAEYGLFDVIILSREMAEAFHMQPAGEAGNVVQISVVGE